MLMQLSFVGMSMGRVVIQLAIIRLLIMQVGSADSTCVSDVVLWMLSAIWVNR